MGSGRIQSLTIDLAGAAVPSVLIETDSKVRSPGVLLLHGYGSSKERLAKTMGRSLATRGIISLAIDLPLHGSREDLMFDEARNNPLGLMRHWKRALAEAKAAIEWLRSDKRVNADKIAIAGYSLGSFVALETAKVSREIRAVIIAAGGDLPQTPWTGMVRTLSDPLRSVASLNGRPLLMLHGKRDRTIAPVQARRLYDAASHPKELRWFDSGHVLPEEAADYAASWLIGVF